MAFQGYLLRINGVILPNRFIALNTYTTIPNQTQDLDSYIDGDGFLHRNILPHRRSKCEFNTPYIREVNNAQLQSYFPDTISMTAQYWNPRKGIYETGTFYTPDLNFTIYKVKGNDIIYNPIRIALIEY